MTNRTIQLRDNRTLGYSEYGSLSGRPLLYFHGHPGSRHEAKFLEKAALVNDVRLIGLDRPGIGLSTFKNGRWYLDYPNDVIELADNLHLDKFAIVGFSGGAPYALSCAYKISARLTSCGIVSGVGELNSFFAFLARTMPYILTPLSHKFFKDIETGEKSLLKFSQKWIASDRQCLEDKNILSLMVSSLVEAFHQGTKGVAYEGTLFGKHWGFQPQDIKFKINIWHGQLDKEISINKARHLAGKLSNCQAKYFSSDGHISTIVNHSDEIVQILMQTTSCRIAGSP